MRFDGVRFVVSDRQNAPALRSSFVSSLFEAPDGTLWIGTYGGGLARLRNGRIEAFHPELLGSDRIREMHRDRATERSSSPRRAADCCASTARRSRASRRATVCRAIGSGRSTDDGEGGLWVATHGGGVVRWRDRRVQQRITTREGLPNDFARALLRDPDGTLWIGTDGGGLAAWRDGSIVRIVTTRDGLPSDFIRTLAARPRRQSLDRNRRRTGALARSAGRSRSASPKGCPARSCDR